MSRQLFIHHYLPALYFAVLMLALLFDLLTAGLRPRYRLAAASAMVLVTVLTFSEFSPITYAQPWTLRSCERARWMKPWDFNCREFPSSLSDYRTLPPGVHSISATSPVAAGVNATQNLNLGAPQPGQHAFEDAPRKAAQSGGGQGGAVVPQPQAAHPVEAAAPPAPAAANNEAEEAFSIQPIHQPGDGVMPQVGAGGNRKAQDLDQEQVEQIMLEGTQHVGDAGHDAGGAQGAPIQAAAGPSGAARLDDAKDELPPV